MLELEPQRKHLTTWRMTDRPAEHLTGHHDWCKAQAWTGAVQEKTRAQKPRATTKDPGPGGYKVRFAALGRQFPAVTLVISYTALGYVLRKTGKSYVEKVSYIHSSATKEWKSKIPQPQKR